MAHYTYTPYEYQTPAELTGQCPRRHQVVIVGAGPVGLAAAIDLALQGIASVVIDDNNVVSVGSRAICWAKRTLEIFDRLGVGERMLAKGVTWQVGRVYHRDEEVYNFNLLPESGHKMPAFINLQQYYVEQYLVERAQQMPHLIELRWKNKLIDLQQHANGVSVDVETPDGIYTLNADWLIAADGARSRVRHIMNLPFDGHVFEEKFLIADISMRADYPSDRRFWFEPTFDPAESVLIHRQPDDIFRIDFQLGWDADAEVAREPSRVIERVRNVVGPDVDFELDWCSVYTFRCARLERFVHDRVVFVGDSAHVVSPFGARGGNGGIQDIDNLCWKLALVLKGKVSLSLIETYNAERVHGSDENIRNSSRTTRFMTPKTQVEKQFRNGVLALAHDFPFARKLVNSGRLSMPCHLAGLPGIALDNADEHFDSGLVPGSPCLDAPVKTGVGPEWLINKLGNHFTILTFCKDMDHAVAQEQMLGEGFALLAIVPDGTELARENAVADAKGLAAQRYGGAPGVTYLIRPDQHVAARFRHFNADVLKAAINNASARNPA